MIDESMNLQMEYVNKDNDTISVYIVNDCTTLVLNQDRPSKSYNICDWEDVCGEWTMLFDSIRYMNSADPCLLDTIDYLRESEETPSIDWEAVIEKVKEVL